MAEVDTGGGDYIGRDKIVHGDEVGRDKITINRYFVAARSHLPSFTTAVDNFLANYLGTPAHPVPFGGREAALARLERWRCEGESQRLLLIAPAGRGKSALLVRWSHRLLAQAERVAVIFLPVSVRFNTNREEVTFSLLAAELAGLYGEEIPTDYANFTPETWRGLVAHYLRDPLPDGRQLLLIVDGLDEAAWDAGADMFPHRLPPNTRLLLSARTLAGESGPEGWLRRLGWDRFPEAVERMTLERLDEPGVRDVLLKMGAPLDELGARVDVVPELYRLSEGDPLLVELYVEALWQRREAASHLRVADLAALAPGYAGFFDSWWQDQQQLWGAENPLKERLVRALLQLLAGALGPLRLEDVQVLLPEELDADSFLIRDAVDPLARFVIGDGHQQGYTFAHPKLGDYFWEQLTPRDRERWRDRFLAWGRETAQALLQGRIHPDAVSAYLRQYYARHLELRRQATAAAPQTARPDPCAAIEDCLALVSHEWSQVWHRQTGSYAGFLRDVERVHSQMQQADQATVDAGAPAPYLGHEIRCLLCHGSINSLVANLPDELLLALLRRGFWTEAQVLAYATQKQNVADRVTAYLALLPSLSPAGQQQIRAFIATVAGSWVDEEQQAEMLVALAGQFPEQVQAVAEGLADPGHRAQVLTALARRLEGEPRQQAARAALVAADGIANELERVATLTALASLGGRVGEEAARAALATPAAIEGDWRRANVLRALAGPWPEEVLAAVPALQSSALQAEVLAAVATSLGGEQGRRLAGEVVAMAEQIEDEGRRGELLAAVAAQAPGEALALARRMTDEWGRIVSLAAVAQYRPAEVVAAVAQASARERARVLAAAAPHLPGEQQRQAAEEAVRAALSIDHEKRRAKVLAAVVCALPGEQGQRAAAAALATLPNIRNEWLREEVLTAAALHLPQNALAVATTIEDEWERAQALRALAAYLPEAVWVAATAVEDHFCRALILAAVAQSLVGESGRQAASEALAALAQSRWVEWQAARELVASFASYLEGERGWQTVAEVKAVVDTLDDKWQRARILALLAEYVEGAPGERLAAEALSVLGQLPRRQRAPDSGYRPQWELDEDEILSSVAGRVPEQVLALVPTLARWRQAEILLRLAAFLPEEAVGVALAIEDEWERVRALAALAEQLPRQVWAAAEGIENAAIRAEVLRAVAAYLEGEEQQQALAEATAASGWLEEMEEGVEPAGALAQYVEEEQMLPVAPEMWMDDDLFWHELASLAQQSPEQALAVAWQIEDEWLRAQALVEVARYQPERVLAVAGEIANEATRVDVLVAVAERLPEGVLAVAAEVEDESLRADLLVTVAEQLPEGVLAVAAEIEDESLRADVLVEVAKYLPEQVRDAAAGIRDGAARGWVLAVIADHVEGETGQRAAAALLADMEGIESEGARADLLDALLPHLHHLPRSQLYRLWKEELVLQPWQTRAEMLESLPFALLVIHHLGGQEAIAETLRAVQDVTTWWP